MVRRATAFALAIGLVGVGLWVSGELGALQMWLFGAGLVGLVGITVETFLEQPPALEPRSHRQVFAIWASPGLLTVSGLWLAQVMQSDSRMAVAMAVAALMGVLLLGLQGSLSPAGRYHRPGRFVVNLILYLSVFLLFALIYHTKEQIPLVAAATGVVALLAALEVLRSGRVAREPSWRLSAVVALVIAQGTWAISFWPVSGLIGGALLLLAFYVLTGLLSAAQEGGVDRRVLMEYGTVGAIGLAAVSWALF